MPGFFDIESGPAAKFDKPGDTVSGTVTHPYATRQATEIYTNKPKVDDQGRPIMMAVIELQTEQRDPAVRDDTGVRIVYAEKFGMRKAISDAIKAASADDLEAGGRLTVQLVREDPTTKGNPLKVFAAQYVKPQANGGVITGVGAPQTAPATTGSGLPAYQPAQPQPSIVADARAVQQAAKPTVSLPAQPAPLDPISGIAKVRELHTAGFDNATIVGIVPQFTMDQVQAILNLGG
jgi:hypothetical protein